MPASSGPGFSPGTAAIFIFNLVVGTGALALPNAFEQAGWLLGTLLLLLLALVSLVTAGWVVESMAACNGILAVEQSINDHRIAEDLSEERKEEERNYFEESESEQGDKTYLVRTDLVGQVAPTYGTATMEGSPCTLTRQLELADMAELLYSKFGRLCFSLCMVIYLLGDLAIYCAAVAKSLRDVTCTGPEQGSNSTNSSNEELPGTDICWQGSVVTRGNAYRVYVAVFLLLLGPFTFFNLSKTKYLQMFTTVMRWLAFTTMVVLALVRLTDPSQTHGEPSLAKPGNMPAVFGVSVYAFMCHHSIPSLVTPVRTKSKIPAILGLDFVVIAAFYLLVSLTGIFAFDRVPDLYTLAFQPAPGSNPSVLIKLVDYFLNLFPVFTLSTNFPIIAITLRNNLEAIVTGIPIFSGMSPLCRRLVFPLLAVLPPTLIALATEDVGILVTITGSFAGTGIQYVIPATLVWLARRKIAQLEAEVGRTLTNPLSSPLKHTAWLLLVLAWSFLAIGLVVANFVIKAMKTT